MLAGLELALGLVIAVERMTEAREPYQSFRTGTEKTILYFLLIDHSPLAGTDSKDCNGIP